MSMNFGREQSLLRQRLTAAGSPETAAATQASLGGDITSLGAPKAAIAAAAHDLLAQYPQMGRAQMTAFVRTLWQSKVHELRGVGVEVLAERVALLEAADLPVVEKMVADESAGGLSRELADRVVGPMVARHKRLWKDLERFAATGKARLAHAAVVASRSAVLADGESFGKFAKMAEKLLPNANDTLLADIDATLQAGAEVADAPAREFASKHGRTLPAAKAAPVSKPTVAIAPAAPPPAAAAAKPVAAAAPKTAKKAVKKAAKKVAKPAPKKGAPSSAQKPSPKPPAKKAPTKVAGSSKPKVGKPKAGKQRGGK
ncbi:MAG: hypothetical protein RL398_3529 [Planctomycetota bacterium]